MSRVCEPPTFMAPCIDTVHDAEAVVRFEVFQAQSVLNYTFVRRCKILYDANDSETLVPPRPHIDNTSHEPAVGTRCVYVCLCESGCVSADIHNYVTFASIYFPHCTTVDYAEHKERVQYSLE